MQFNSLLPAPFVPNGFSRYFIAPNNAMIPANRFKGLSFEAANMHYCGKVYGAGYTKVFQGGNKPFQISTQASGISIKEALSSEERSVAEIYWLPIPEDMDY